jgi:hypothetical protein
VRSIQRSGRTPAQATIELDWYERLAMADVQRWLSREAGIADRALGGASSRTRRSLDAVLDVPRVRRRVEDATDEVVTRLASTTRELGAVSPPRPTSDASARARALRRTDRAAGDLHARCVGAMTVEGIAAGAASMTPVTAVLSLLPDVAAALSISTTAAARMLVLYGSVTPGPAALEKAVQISAVATEADPQARRRRFLELARQLEGSDPEPPSADEVSELVAQQMAVRTVRETIEQTIRRLAGRRLAVSVPLLSIAVHAVAAGWHGGQVCEATRHLGRTSHIARSTSTSTEGLLLATRAA